MLGHRLLPVKEALTQGVGEGSKVLMASVSPVITAVFPSHPLRRECKSVQALWKTVWHYSVKLNIHLPSGPADFTPRCILERNSCAWTPGDLYKSVHSVSVHNSKRLEAAQMPISGGMDEYAET